MIACPICGRSTAVVETRASSVGVRRRRKCTDAACIGRVTTVEVVVKQTQSAKELADGRAVIVPHRVIARLQRVVALLGGTA